MESYNLIDLCIIGTLGVGFVIGLWKGFIRSLTATAGLVVGGIVAMRYYQVVEPYLGKVSSLDPHVAMVLSMIAMFIGVQVVFVLVRRVLEALIDVTRLGWFDRLVGAGLGVAAGTLLVAGAVQVVWHLVPEWTEIRSSRLMEPVSELTGNALKHAPKEVQTWMDTVNQKWKGIGPDGRRPSGTDAYGANATSIPHVSRTQQGPVRPQ
ncbi:MAG: CvpA family protein [Thermodesulfobacteriota bacterium]